jgi:hypothetical protein
VGVGATPSPIQAGLVYPAGIVWLVRRPAAWIWRRVDSFEFIDDVTIRRRASVDFTLPETYLTKAYEPRGADSVYLAPLGLLKKDPLNRFDLRNEEGAAMSLLTSKETSRVVAAAIVATATARLGPRIESSVVRDVVEVVRGSEAEATSAFNRIVEPRRTARTTRWLLAHDPELRGILRELVRSFIVLVPVTKDPRRRILKMAYDQDLEPGPRRRLSLGQKLGWRKATVNLRVPEVGFSAAYHADIQTPTDVEILRAQLLVNPGDERYSKDVRCRDGVRHTHLYRAGIPPSAAGVVSLELRVTRPGLIRAGFLIAVLAALLLTAGSLRLDAVAKHPEVASTVLVLIPALLAAALLRPGEHELASKLLVGVRALVLGSGLLSIASAGSLLIGLGHHARAVVWWVLSGLAWGFAAALAFSYVLPRTYRSPRRDDLRSVD